MAHLKGSPESGDGFKDRGFLYILGFVSLGSDSQALCEEEEEKKNRRDSIGEEEASLKSVSAGGNRSRTPPARRGKKQQHVPRFGDDPGS